MQPLASPLLLISSELVKGLALVYKSSSADRQVLGFCYICIHAMCGPEEGSTASVEPDVGPHAQHQRCSFWLLCQFRCSLINLHSHAE